MSELQSDRSLIERKKDRFLPEIAIVRFFCIFAVICVHASSVAIANYDPKADSYFLVSFFNRFFKFGTPTFILLSAFVYFNAYWKKEWQDINWKRYVQTRLSFVLLPYVIFATFYFPVRYIVNPINKSMNEMITLFFDQFWVGKTYFHLYFIIVILQFYLLFPLILWLFKKYDLLIRYAIPIGFVLQWAFYFLNLKFGWFEQRKGSVFLSYMSFYLLGAYLGVYYQQFRDGVLQAMSAIRKWFLVGAVILTTGLMLNYVVQSYWIFAKVQKVSSLSIEAAWNFYLLPMSVLLIILAIRSTTFLSKRVLGYMQHLGARSFGIYLIHPFFLIVYRLYDAKGLSNLTYLIWIAGGFFFSFAASYLVIWFMERYIPFYSYLIGKISNA